MKKILMIAYCLLLSTAILVASASLDFKNDEIQKHVNTDGGYLHAVVTHDDGTQSFQYINGVIIYQLKNGDQVCHLPEFGISVHLQPDGQVLGIANLYNGSVGYYATDCLDRYNLDMLKAYIDNFKCEEGINSR